MNPDNHKIYASCVGCGCVMKGIHKDSPMNHGDYRQAREKCEPCGGNSTEYNASNPRPKLGVATENGERVC